MSVHHPTGEPRRDARITVSKPKPRKYPRASAIVLTLPPGVRTHLFCIEFVR
jgi:hypothetical protein